MYFTYNKLFLIMGKLFVISAPSGTGKTSLIQAILEDPIASNTYLGISCTTRKARPKEETVFIIPPSYEDLTRRLETRDQDSKTEIAKRLKEARNEVNIGKDFDQVIVNDDFDAALEDLKQFMFTSEGITNERSEIIKNSLDLLLD